jgi:hypothetical protein
MCTNSQLQQRVGAHWDLYDWPARVRVHDCATPGRGAAKTYRRRKQQALVVLPGRRRRSMRPRQSRRCGPRQRRGRRGRRGGRGQHVQRSRRRGVWGVPGARPSLQTSQQHMQIVASPPRPRWSRHPLWLQPQLHRLCWARGGPLCSCRAVGPPQHHGQIAATPVVISQRLLLSGRHRQRLRMNERGPAVARASNFFYIVVCRTGESMRPAQLHNKKANPGLEGSPAKFDMLCRRRLRHPRATTVALLAWAAYEPPPALRAACKRGQVRAKPHATPAPRAR